MKNKEIFKRELSEYTTTMDPIKNYLESLTKFIEKHKSVDTPTATKLAKEIINKADTTNPIVTYRNRLHNGDREITTDTLTAYLKDSIRNKDIVVPSLTVYDNPKVKKSIHSTFLATTIAGRKIDKGLAAKYKTSGDMERSKYHNILQKVKKIFSNSLSGAYASKSTVLYNPSQHYTLTSMTGAVASIGNAVTESMVAGNKHFRTPEVMFNYVVGLLTGVNLVSIAAVVIRYKLHIPTSDEVMDMLLYSSRNYWTNHEKEAKIKEYLDKLDKYELCALMYVNDMYHLAKYNDDVMRTMLGKISERVTTGSDNPKEDLDNSVEGICNLAHHICMEDIKGMHIDYNDESIASTLKILGSTVKNITNVLSGYATFIKAFFVTDILPIDISNIRGMYRDSIVLSDTDSTCGAYDFWAEWYTGTTALTQEGTAITATVMTFNTQAIDHYIRVFAKNMNIAAKDVGLLKMKSEYFWHMFVPANVSKHYYATTLVVEGVVHPVAELELKGVHLIASKANQEVVKTAHNMMRDIGDTIAGGRPIDPLKYINLVVEKEKWVTERVGAGDLSFFTYAKVRTPDSYKSEDKSKSPYFHYMVWNEAFADKYGQSDPPTYMAIKVSTTINTKRLLREWLESIEDREIAAKLDKVFSDNNKVSYGTALLPFTVINNSGIPDELIPAIDIYRMVVDNLSPLYTVLETLGIYRKPNLLLKDMGY